MKNQYLKFAIAVICFHASAALAQEANLWGKSKSISITNGGAMPISPPVFWIAKGRALVPTVGNDSTEGQRKICETGDSSLFKKDLQNNKAVRWHHEASAPVLPGQSLTVMFPKLNDRAGERLYVAFMYGKTRNLCGGLFDINDAAEMGRDTVFSSGAYGAPSVMNINTDACAANSNAVACLRSLSMPLDGQDANKVRAFVGYLPSVLTEIESRYGSDEAAMLLVPTSGAVTYSIKTVP